MTLLLNGIRASSVRRIEPWSGVWACDVELDLGDLGDLPTGPGVLVIDKTVLQGTIDPAHSGRFGHRARARLVGGAAGWETTVAAKHYHNDAGVLSTSVLATTAAEVKERVVEALPSRFGKDYVRPAGPASSVLATSSWYVDRTGTTIVGPRVRTPATPDVQILAWDARTKVATLATGDVLSPGTILVDPRFGTAMIRDVEQTWSDNGPRALAWTISPQATPPAGVAGGELVAAVKAIARDAVGGPFAKVHRYRVVVQTPDGRFNLQAIKKARGIPDLKAISLAPAVPGMSVKVSPGTIVHIAFADGDRSQPFVVRFESGPKPIEVSFNPTAFVQVGTGILPTAGPVAMAAGTTSAINAIKTLISAWSSLVPGGAAAAATFEAAIAPILASIASTKLKAE